MVLRSLFLCNKKTTFVKFSQKLRHYLLYKIHWFNEFRNLSKCGFFLHLFGKTSTFWLVSGSIVLFAQKSIHKMKFRHWIRVQHQKLNLMIYVFMKNIFWCKDRCIPLQSKFYFLYWFLRKWQKSSRKLTKKRMFYQVNVKKSAFG